MGQSQFSFNESGSNISIGSVPARQSRVTPIARFLKDDASPESARWFANRARSGNGSDSPRAGGFSFMDIVIAISVAGIMAVVGLPSYRSFAAETHYIHKKRDLLTLQGNVENFYASNRYRSDGSLSFAGRSAIDFPYVPSSIDIAYATDQTLTTHRTDSSSDQRFDAASSPQLHCPCIDSALVNLIGASFSPTGAGCPAGAAS
jgi:Tfp pilus assembly protein PilE